ncbi:MAG: DUF6063 family protein [Lachnospiraceae bacterium]|nr:DUF6063 family protein [Lachnospiraceae bacterium]
MSYEIDQVKGCQEIFYHLIKFHELSAENNERLYKLYVENEEIQNLVKLQGEVADSRIERYGNVVYLIPHEDNYCLGFTKTELKQYLCKSGATDKDYYLAQFVILVLLTEFYDGQGSSSRTRDFMRVGELQNSISERLKEGCSRMKEEDELREGLAFTDMQAAYESLRSDENGKRAKTTKEGFLNNILLFLQKQGLVEYLERDDTVITTPRLDNFMDWDILNEKNFKRVERVFAENREFEKTDTEELVHDKLEKPERDNSEKIDSEE